MNVRLINVAVSMDRKNWQQVAAITEPATGKPLRAVFANPPVARYPGIQPPPTLWSVVTKGGRPAAQARIGNEVTATDLPQERHQCICQRLLAGGSLPM